MSCNYSPNCKTFIVMGFIWLLLFVNGSHERRAPTAAAKMAAKSGGETKADGDRGGKLVRPKWHLNYMSKRRVPNGPDPIHNRRAGNSGRPPGKA